MDPEKVVGKPAGKRRTMLKGILGVGLTTVFAPILYAVGRYLGYQGGGSGQKDVMIGATDVSADHPSKLLDINDQPVLVIYQAGHGIRAFNAKCTHLGCTVSYQPEVPGFYCKCHHGRYDANGINVPGTRPKRPLTELTIVEKDGQLDVTLIPKQQPS
ncbi:MAG TPA: Rieske 2Fe-2S domain-containing protein [Candidatus Kapabacteria bacterium]|nr:Rieske 2Fe-2S domain-containing protein [Candidatus Kapabacteria bacterium]